MTSRTVAVAASHIADAGASSNAPATLKRFHGQRMPLSGWLRAQP